VNGFGEAIGSQHALVIAFDQLVFEQRESDILSEYTKMTQIRPAGPSFNSSCAKSTSHCPTA
jgi:hypothetical protein